jgi:hypothetical protein
MLAMGRLHALGDYVVSNVVADSAVKKKLTEFNTA